MICSVLSLCDSSHEFVEVAVRGPCSACVLYIKSTLDLKLAHMVFFSISVMQPGVVRYFDCRCVVLEKGILNASNHIFCEGMPYVWPEATSTS